MGGKSMPIRPPVLSGHLVTEKQDELTAAATFKERFRAGRHHVHLRWDPPASTSKQCTATVAVWQEDFYCLTAEKFYCYSLPEAMVLFEKKKREAAVANATEALRG